MMNNNLSASLRGIKDFEIPIFSERLSIGKSPETSGRIKAESLTTDQIVSMSDESQKQLRTELERLISAVFPIMPEKDWKAFVDKFFKHPINISVQRHIVLFRNEKNDLAGACSFDFGDVEYEGKTIKAIYIILRAILNEYQGCGLGQIIASTILMELQPDILMVNCYQSSSLHSWLRLLSKGVATGFEVYPRMERSDGKDVLITLPFKDMDYVMCVFKYIFPYPPERLEKIMKDFTVLMARKNDHEGVYDFNPWEKNGRKDNIADALGLTSKDGVLVVFKKIKSH